MQTSQNLPDVVDLSVIETLKGKSAVPYSSKIPVEKIGEYLSYNPDTGEIRWIKSPAKNVAVGSLAGCVKATRVGSDGLGVSYRYIRLGQEIPAARVAWVLHYGAWPSSKVLFKDGDPLNLQITNLALANALLDKYDHSDQDQRKAYLRDHRKAYPKVWKNTYLMRGFGITLQEYGDMLVKQNGVCAICQRPETEMRGGNLKALAVDHNHNTGKVRDLLCAACNQMIGKAQESRDTLLAAVRYLDKHADVDRTVVTLTSKGKV